jgi:hypothetical protein
MDRRRFIAAAASGPAVALAACTGMSGPSDQSSGGSGDGVRDDNEGDDGGDSGDSDELEGTSVTDHPAAAGLADQPRRGDLEGHVILAFEDPSCSRCATFERQTVPEIREQIVDAGAGAFVFRTYPVVYEWGKPATQALEATFSRSEAAFWALADHYCARQGEFTPDNVLDRTASFLADETDVDAGAVVDAAEAKAHDDAVQADLDAGQDANVGRTTPTVLLFRDGTYTTRASGSVSYELVANALGEG